MAHMDLRPRTERLPHSLLWHVNATLARPIAALFGMLGIAAGQLSLQSVTLTTVGLLRMATGSRWDIVQGALIVYLGFLVDRADDLIAARGKPPSAWSRFLGQMADRLVEAALVVSLAWLALVGPGPGPGPLSAEGLAIVVACLFGALFLARAARSTGDMLILRMHLSSARRLPGPSAVPRIPQVRAILGRLLDRDAFVAVWVAGVATGWLQPATFALMAMEALVAIEAFVLVWSRRRDPEPYAAEVLARGP